MMKMRFLMTVTLWGMGICLFLLKPSVQANPANLKTFRGTVTAVNVNEVNKDRCFTAIDKEGKVKIFKIRSLAHLDVSDRVILNYWDSQKFPLMVTKIKFLTPKK